jgi:hypothetical protein
MAAFGVMALTWNPGSDNGGSRPAKARGQRA